jgi:beta-fructofuranosidase
MEIMVAFEAGSAKTFGLKVRRSHEGQRAVTISCNRESLDIAGVEVPFQLAGNEEMVLHVFLDKSVVEVFVNDGRKAVSKVIYPPGQDLGIELFATGGTAVVRSLDIWQIKPIGGIRGISL